MLDLFRGAHLSSMKPYRFSYQSGVELLFQTQRFPGRYVTFLAEHAYIVSRGGQRFSDSVNLGHCKFQYKKMALYTGY